MNELFTADPNFRAYALALVRYHDLLSEGQDDDLRIETVEESMTALWGALNDEQRCELRGISSDLNWIRRGCLAAPKARLKEEISQAELEAFGTHLETASPLTLLQAVRTCSAALEPELIADCRVRCYAALGLPEVAQRFLQALAGLNSKRAERLVVSDAP